MSLNQLISSIKDCDVSQFLIYGVLLVGVFKVTFLTLNTASLLFDLFILPSVNYKKYGAKQGNWAVVTGASDGIGKEYALQLASKGLNIVLISRTQSKLELIATDIETKYKVETKIIAFDVSTDESTNYDRIAETIKDLPVTILINNVGQSHSIPVPFLETEDKELRDIITINNTATLKITQVVAPIIASTVAKQSKKIRGLILTMGSFGGLLPTPYLATYSGSKAFLQAWSSALAGELKPQGIDVELIISYLVTSAMSKIRRTSLLIPNPKQFVKATLNGVGRRNGAQERYATNTPYWTHAFMHFGIEQAVGVYSKLANTLNYDMHKSIRTRALKKAARLAAEKKD
ncbi:3-ketoacyl-CoA reductase [Scheffersomyces coipomensis]|uniref:3-ketoacyl-CoA reductase n=1 Tax=Scheffersomyces coipomensis TaxID=1788519 RepID=UPI00315DB73C